MATTDTTVTVKVTYAETGRTPSGYVLTNTDSSWKVHGDVSEQYKQAEASASASAAVANSSRWLENWCKIEKGMTKEQAEALMGAPTATFDATRGTPQDQWQQGAFSFTAFFDTDSIVNGFWMNTDSLGKNDLAKVPCYKNRS